MRDEPADIAHEKRGEPECSGSEVGETGVTVERIHFHLNLAMAAQAAPARPTTTTTTQNQPQDGLGLAIVIVIDASVTIAEQWHSLILPYLSSILRRLAEVPLITPTRPVGEIINQFQVAVVSYGMQNIRPSPIIRTTYFVHPHLITKQLRDEPDRDLGLGKSPDGGDTGMATLDALVAALEVCL
jgi:hypothetical protein